MFSWPLAWTWIYGALCFIVINLEALMLFPGKLLVVGEFHHMKVNSCKMTNWLSFDVIRPVALSCIFALSIAFFGFSCSCAISVTGFMVLGIVNKLLTIVVNLLIWDRHSSLVGTTGLLICISGGVLHQHSTRKFYWRKRRMRRNKSCSRCRKGGRHEMSSTEEQSSFIAEVYHLYFFLPQ